MVSTQSRTRREELEMTNKSNSLKKWTTKAGLEAEVVYYPPQHHALGAWHCGYVQVPVDSPLNGVDFMDSSLKRVEVHGGLTFSGRDKEGLWWCGFDTNHYQDSVFEQHQEFVENQCEKLALQLKTLIDKQETKEAQTSDDSVFI